MAFNYISPSGIRLTASEEKLIESIDDFKYPLGRQACLGNLHRQLKGGVELSNQKKARSHHYYITAGERNAIIVDLDAEISKINDKLTILRIRYSEAHENKNEKQAMQIEKDMGELGRKRMGLEKTRDAYQNAHLRNGGYEMQADIVLLGEYDPLLKKVILYYKCISSEELLAEVYVHEMMHAYLDCGYVQNYFDKIEEPIVECAMLNFFKNFDKQICASAENHVKEKQQTPGIAHYGFGYCVFKNPNGVEWLEDYKNVKSTLTGTNTTVAAYLDYWRTGVYPYKNEKQVLEALYKALHGTSKAMIVKSSSKSVVEQSKNKNDLIKKLDRYLTLHSPIAPLANALNPTDHKDWLEDGWKESSARQYSDWLNPIIHPELNSLLNKHRLYGDIYNCTNLGQITDIFKELVEKTTPEAIQAYGNSENMVSAVRHFIEHLLEINHIILP